MVHVMQQFKFMPKVLLFWILTQLVTLIAGAAVPDVHTDPSISGVLNREHYGLRIREVLDHIYGSPALRKRQDGSPTPSCREGGTPTFVDGNLLFCTYDTPVSMYNNAISDIHFNRTQEDVNGNPVYISDNTDTTFPEPSAKDDNAVAKRADVGGHLPELPNGWAWTNKACFGSGTWALSSTLETIRYKYCHMLSDLREVGTLRHVTFYYGFTNNGEYLGARLKAEDGNEIQVDTEFAPQGNAIPPNNINVVCLATCSGLIWRDCLGVLGARPRYLSTPPNDGGGDKKPPAGLSRNDPEYWEFIRSIKNPFIGSTIDYFIRSYELVGSKGTKLQFPDWQSSIVFTIPELPESLKGHEADADGIPLPPNTFIANSPSELRDLVAEIIERKRAEPDGRTEEDINSTPPAEPLPEPELEPKPETESVPAGRPLIRKVLRDYAHTVGGEAEPLDQSASQSLNAGSNGPGERPDFTELKSQIEKLHDDVSWFLLRSAEIEAVSPYLSHKQKYRARLEFAQAKKLLVKLRKRIEALHEIDSVFKQIRKRPAPGNTAATKRAPPELADDYLEGFEAGDRKFLKEFMATAADQTAKGDAGKRVQTEAAHSPTKFDSIWESGAFKTISDFMKGTPVSSDETKSFSSSRLRMPSSGSLGPTVDLGRFEDRMVQRVGEVMSDRLREMQDVIQDDIEGASKETTKFTERMQSLENLVHQLLRNQGAAKGAEGVVYNAESSGPASEDKDPLSPKQPLSHLNDYQRSSFRAEVDAWVKEIVEECIEELEDLQEDEEFDIVSDLEKSGLVRDMADRALAKVLASKKLQQMLDEAFDNFREDNDDLQYIVAKSVEESVKEVKEAPEYRRHKQLLKQILKKARYEQNGWSIDVTDPNMQHTYNYTLENLTLEIKRAAVAEMAPLPLLHEDYESAPSSMLSNLRFNIFTRFQDGSMYIELVSRSSKGIPLSLVKEASFMLGLVEPYKWTENCTTYVFLFVSYYDSEGHDRDPNTGNILWDDGIDVDMGPE
ncbi:hypothetical protein Dda_4824 [Drechslerella dactyloides]|uniref:Uncharacterized protein n=1 Tax=Drechslerella dactyloides TaxID=74499 RepID=A0AAD6IXM1_DREDA|nr:hypothetical protein Dda_4824 [Drechslerella dactyloides]